MGAPKLKHRKLKVHVTITEKIHKRAVKEAQDKGMSLSMYLETLVRERLEEKEAADATA